MSMKQPLQTKEGEDGMPAEELYGALSGAQPQPCSMPARDGERLCGEYKQRQQITWNEASSGGNWQGQICTHGVQESLMAKLVAFYRRFAKLAMSSSKARKQNIISYVCHSRTFRDAETGHRLVGRLQARW